MIAPLITHAESRLIDDASANITAIKTLVTHERTDHESVQRELAWNECLLHLLRHKGLSFAGREEARKLIEASREWVAEFTGEEAGHGR